MTSFNPSLNWELLDTVFYRSRICYDSLNWPFDEIPDFNLNNYNVSISPYVSTIALYPKQLSLLSSFDDKILILSASGNKLFTINWNFTLNPISDIGWSINGNLLIIFSSGKFRNYYNYQGDFQEFDLFKIFSLNDNITITNTIFNNFGFSIKTSNNIFIYIQNQENPSLNSSIILNQLETSTSIEPYDISSWSVSIPPDTSVKSLNEIKFYIFTSNGLLILKKGISNNHLDFIQKSLLNSISLISISPNQNFIALISLNPLKLYIFDEDFNNLLIERDLNSIPLDLKWCSNDAIVLSYNDNLLILGPSQDKINFLINDKPYLHTQSDGLYYLTNNELSFFSRVSNITEDTFKIGSTSPSAILLDSIEYLDKHSPKANDLLKIINNQLVLAVDNCIRAANEEFDIYWQKNLLRAANFGKINIDLYDPTEFVQTCNFLRILNIIRSPEIGIFLTYNQLINLTIEKLIDLLLLRSMHYLCLKICNLLNLPNYKILTHWALNKIKNSTNLNDGELLSIILNKLKGKKINWIEIANVAYDEGRLTLSKNLLSFEPNTNKKIQFLININLNSKSNEIEYALTKADEDMDSDSIMLLLLELYNSLSNTEFFKIINNKRNVIGIFKSSINQIDDNLLKNYMYQDDDILGQIILNLENSEKIQSLINRSKYTKFMKSSILNDIKLKKYQTELKDSIPNIEIGESAIDTLEKIILIDLKQASTYSHKFNVSKKQFASCVLKTLAPINGKHAELYEFATSQAGGKLLKFETFYHTLIKLGEKRQAGMYLPLCKSMGIKQKIKAYIQCGMWKEAVIEAGSRNEIEILKQMKGNSNAWESKIVSDELERVTGQR
jgi:hypothetical protein